MTMKKQWNKPKIVMISIERGTLSGSGSKIEKFCAKGSKKRKCANPYAR